jgi:periplasmic divalent cation tolerance protein
MTAPDVLIVLCTASTEKEAMTIAQALVEREEAACVNLVPMIRSVFRWKGKIWNENEQLLVIKTTAAAFEDLRRTIKELHSYELPEILALPVSDGEPNALAWIGSSVRHGRDNP